MPAGSVTVASRSGGVASVPGVSDCGIFKSNVSTRRAIRRGRLRLEAERFRLEAQRIAARHRRGFAELASLVQPGPFDVRGAIRLERTWVLPRIHVQGRDERLARAVGGVCEHARPACRSALPLLGGGITIERGDHVRSM